MQHVKRHTIALVLLLAMVFFNLTSVAQAQVGVRNRQSSAETKVTTGDDQPLSIDSQKVKKRFGLYSRRLNSMMQKLQQQIEIAKSQGKDTTLIEEKAALAQVLVWQADQQAEDISLALPSADDDTKIYLAQQTEQTRLQYMTALQLLREAVSLLKQAS